MRKVFSLCLAVSACFLSQVGYGENLLQIYDIAVKNDATLQAAQATYAAAKEALPISRANLLPSINLSASSTLNLPKNSTRYNSNGYTLTLTQPIFNLSAWFDLKQTDIAVKQAFITFEQAKQTLIVTVAQDYFNILEAQDKLRYTEKYLAQIKQRLDQAEQMYKVGLKAYTDVQTAKASYESAKADVVSAQNAVANAFAELTTITGREIQHITPLNPKFPLLTPQPDQAEPWVRMAEKSNLQYLSDRLAAESQQAGITVAQAGDGTVPGYYPTLSANLARSASTSHTSPLSQSMANTASLNVSYNIFNGGATLANVQKAKYTYQASFATAEATLRNTQSNTRQAFLNVLSDISQVQALQQAIISGEASLKASRAAYQVGTRTIVDLLTQESDLFSTQQKYAEATYSYLTDSLILKQTSGILNATDITVINQWLGQNGKSPAKKTQ